ncbi:hypothetical protein [Bradyrhizobium sp. INPA03-11B]|uniref:hypothetical protein n=1 Tax=Bradyrhizobium sp. INPA03-11B TaxID=418598 RepID=UPI00338D4066
MGGPYGNAFSGLRPDPAAEDAAAGEDQPVNGAALDHGNFHVAIKGGGFDPFPGNPIVSSGMLFIVAD